MSQMSFPTAIWYVRMNFLNVSCTISLHYAVVTAPGICTEYVPSRVLWLNLRRVATSSSYGVK
jgi:hypothetical protein